MWPGRSRGLWAVWLLGAAAGCGTVPRPGEPLPAITVPTSLTAGTGLQVRPAEFIAYPAPSRFSICYGGTCAQRATVGLTPEEWGQVRSLFSPPPASAAAERETMRAAVALLERLVGAKTGTDQDLAMDVAGFGKPGQLDCVDESIDTSVYLTMMQNDGLLRRHTAGGRATRGPFTGVMQAPHATAVIRENLSGERYAVDSWWLDNGQPPFVVPMSEWMAGWRPGIGP